jgi:hypothetical protein
MGQCPMALTLRVAADRFMHHGDWFIVSRLTDSLFYMQVACGGTCPEQLAAPVSSTSSNSTGNWPSCSVDSHRNNDRPANAEPLGSTANIEQHLAMQAVRLIHAIIADAKDLNAKSIVQPAQLCRALIEPLTQLAATVNTLDPALEEALGVLNAYLAEIHSVATMMRSTDKLAKIKIFITSRTISERICERQLRLKEAAASLGDVTFASELRAFTARLDGSDRLQQQQQRDGLMAFMRTSSMMSVASESLEYAIDDMDLHLDALNVHNGACQEAEVQGELEVRLYSFIGQRVALQRFFIARIELLMGDLRDQVVPGPHMAGNGNPSTQGVGRYETAASDAMGGPCGH